MRAVVVLVALAACGRVHFASSPDATAHDATAEVAPDAPPPDPSLVAWYTMDSIAGGVLHDQSGYGNRGACAGAACPTVDTGVIDGALRFDGVAGVIRVPSTPSLSPMTATTVAAWFETDQTGDGNDFSCFVNKVVGPLDNNSWQLCVQGNQLYAGIGYGGATPGTTQTVGPHGVDLGNWHHAAFTWTGATVQVYYDGAPGNSGAVPGPVLFDDGDLSLGADLDEGNVVAPLTGRVDDVRIYNRVLSAAEIAALATPP